MHCSYACAHAARRTRTPESKAEYHRAYRERNRAIINEKQKAARCGPQRERILKRDREAYRRNIEANRQFARNYAASHREEAIARRRAWPALNPERHQFHIARNNLAQSLAMRPSDIPERLVETKLEQLKVVRLVREQRSRVSA